MLVDNFGGWWSDAEKRPADDGALNPAPNNDGDEDDLLCWAATDSNMLEYTGWGYVGGMMSADQSFQYYQDHTTDLGSLTYYGLEWWFDGNLPTPDDTKWSKEDVEGGDFWSPTYDWKTYVIDSTGGSAIMPDIRTWITAGYPVGLGIYGRGGGGHAVTCWGYNFDSSKNPATDPNGYYLGVWLTDSDSDKGSSTPDDRMTYYRVDWDSVNKVWWMPNYGGGWDIKGATALKPFPEARPVADSGGPYVGNEGTAVSFSAAASTDADDSSLMYRWDFDGDGTWDTDWSSSATATNTWDDDFSGKVYLQAFDGQMMDMDVSTVTIKNVDPTISVPGVEIDENGEAALIGTIDDPGHLDTFVLTVNWGDGLGVVKL